MEKEEKDVLVVQSVQGEWKLIFGWRFIYEWALERVFCGKPRKIIKKKLLLISKVGFDVHGQNGIMCCTSNTFGGYLNFCLV